MCIYIYYLYTYIYIEAFVYNAILINLIWDAHVKTPLHFFTEETPASLLSNLISAYGVYLMHNKVFVPPFTLTYR